MLNILHLWSTETCNRYTRADNNPVKDDNLIISPNLNEFIQLSSPKEYISTRVHSISYFLPNMAISMFSKFVKCLFAEPGRNSFSNGIVESYYYQNWNFTLS